MCSTESDQHNNFPKTEEDQGPKRKACNALLILVILSLSSSLYEADRLTGFLGVTRTLLAALSRNRGVELYLFELDD
jgi:hypothetical protein